MGITNLFPYIKQYCEKVTVDVFCGQIAAVDASCWMHRALAVSVSQTGGRERFLPIFTSYLQRLQEAGVIPLVVFDGKKLPAKADENMRRRSRREDVANKAQQAHLTEKERRKLLSQSVEKSYEDMVECIKICINQGVKYIVSPYESDAQISFLVGNGYASFAITEDSDLLVYGCQKILVKLDQNGNGDLFQLDKILEGLQISMIQFVKGCIAAGCDYLHNVRGVGISKAFAHVKSGQLFTELKKKGSDEKYEKMFENTMAVFEHQTVFNPLLTAHQPLNDWTTKADNELLNLCGLSLDKESANEQAAGNINPETESKENSLPWIQIVPFSSESGHIQDSGEGIVTITSIEGEWFLWTIPCFPVISLEFKRAKIVLESKHINGLIRRDADVTLGKFKCSSHCNINIEGVDYMVLWELSALSEFKERSEIVKIIHQEEALPDNTTHTLPFKVLGTCHCAERQKFLEEAYDYLEEYNRPVFVQLEKEPDNPYDEHAIAVYVKTEFHFNKVGYIPSELTQFVNPCMDDPDFDVSIRHIRMRTVFQKIGFYITIDITRRGLWPEEVIKASKKVR